MQRAGRGTYRCDILSWCLPFMNMSSGCCECPSHSQTPAVRRTQSDITFCVTEIFYHSTPLSVLNQSHVNHPLFRHSQDLFLTLPPPRFSVPNMTRLHFCTSFQGITGHDAVDQITETRREWHQHHHS